MNEAKLLSDEHGTRASGEGWYIVNTRECTWFENKHFGWFGKFEGDARFPDFGVNIHVLEPRQPACMYHSEGKQESFLVLFGECRVILEGEERPLKAWDFVHCPAGTKHLFVGGDHGRCAILMIGAREEPQPLLYPVDELAASYGGSVDEETPDPAQAYAKYERSKPARNPWSDFLQEFNRDRAAT